MAGSERGIESFCYKTIDPSVHLSQKNNKRTRKRKRIPPPRLGEKQETCHQKKNSPKDFFLFLFLKYISLLDRPRHRGEPAGPERVNARTRVLAPRDRCSPVLRRLVGVLRRLMTVLGEQFGVAGDSGACGCVSKESLESFGKLVVSECFFPVWRRRGAV